MEKFYIVTNEDFLSSVKKYKDAESERRKLIHRFFWEKRNWWRFILYRW